MAAETTLPLPATLDPFGFQPELTSNVAGLGGPAPGTDPAYVFHSSYVAVPQGPTRATLAFTGLAADSGTLVMRVNALDDGPGARATTIATLQFSLRDLAEGRIAAAAVFDAGPASRYAVLGHVYGPRTATAEALIIGLSEAPSVARVATVVPPISQHGAGTPTATAMLASAQPPSLAEPCAQHATFAQLAEPWAKVAPSGDDACLRWAVAYCVRVLDCHGFRVDGAKVMALQRGLAALDVALRTAGLVVTRTASADPAPDDSGYDVVIADLSIGATAERLFATTLATLRPRGMAILFAPTMRRRGGDAEQRPPAAWTAGDLERLAIDFVSRNHRVAQLSFALDDAVALPEAPDITLFALLVWRGD